MTKHLSIEELEFHKAMQAICLLEVTEEYRAYYNDDGWVTSYEANKFPVTGKWIPITKEVYITHNWQWMRVVDGKLIKQPPNGRYYFPLTKADKGVKVVKHHANIVVEPYEEFNDIEYYELKNN